MKHSLIKFFLCFSFFQIVNIVSAQQSENDIYHEKLFQYIDELNQGEIENFLSAFDTEKFTNRVFEDLPSDNNDMKMFRVGFEKGLKSSLNPSLKTLFEYYDVLEYVSYSKGAGFYSMLLRGTGDQSGLNYIELVIDTSIKDELRIIDIYSFFAGEFMSSIMNRNAKLIIAENSTLNNILSSLSIKEKKFTESLPKLIKMEKYRNMGDLEEIVKVYDTIPESVQKEKVFLLAAIIATQSTDETRYIKLLKTYKDNYPDDPSLPLITLDYHLLRGEIETSKKLIDQLDEIVGGDNYLNITRSNICFIADDQECARSYLEKTIENDQYEEDAYFALLELELIAGNFQEVNTHLTSLENIFGYEFSKESMQQVEVYDTYLKSKEFKEWISSKE